jgi:hypothetical protein
MSYYDDSSLFLSPNGYKTSVLFAQKPMDANGQLAFTRSNSTATRVNSAGLIEKVRTNLVLQSETFQTTWSPQIATIAANATTAPNGTLTADKLVAAVGAGTSVQHRVDQTTTSAIGINTFSVYGKKSEIDIIQLRIGVNGAGFDLTNGTTGGAAAGVTSSILNAGNGWYRCSITFTSVAANEIVRINLATTLSPPSSFIGDGVSGAFIWGAQLETGDIATDYIPTTTAAVSVGPVANLPRIDYTGGGCGKLLLEPQRSNLLTFSEQIDDAAWVKSTTTVTANAQVSPDGYTNAETMTVSTSASIVEQTMSLGAGTYTFSVYVKVISQTTAGQMRLQGLVDAANVSVNFTPTTEWQRFTATYTPTATLTSVRVRGQSFVGTLAVWGAQLEVGAYATSYIPTLGAAVTRGADACSKTGISSLIGQTEGTILIDMEFSALSTNRDIIYIGTSAQAYRLVAAIGNSINAGARVSSSSVNYVTSSALTNGRIKIGYGYKSGEHVLYINGVQIGTSTSTSVPTGTISEIQLGTAIINETISNPINQALLFKTRLSNSELAQLTTI